MSVAVDVVPIVTEHDIARARHAVQQAACQLGFGVVDRTRLVTAASELARNVHRHAGTGDMRIRIVESGGRVGLCLTFRDDGPGIADLALAMTDGYSTSGGLGKGLPGSRRLVDEFDLQSSPGRGTTVTVTKWTRPHGRL